MQVRVIPGLACKFDSQTPTLTKGPTLLHYATGWLANFLSQNGLPLPNPLTLAPPLVTTNRDAVPEKKGLSHIYHIMFDFVHYVV